MLNGHHRLEAIAARREVTVDELSIPPVILFLLLWGSR